MNRSSFSSSQSFSIPSSSYFCSAIFFYGACATNLFACSQPLVFLSATKFAFPLANPHLEPMSLLFFFLCRLYSLRQCRRAHSLSPSFHVEQKLCRPPKPQRLSGFLIVYAYLCNIFFARFCPLSSLVAVFLCSVLLRRRRLPLASTNGFSLRDGRFAFFVQPSSPFIAFAVDAPLLPLRSARRSIIVFVLSARLFGLAAILCFAAARDRRSSFRQSLLFWPLPNLAILLDTAFLLLYNYLAFACDRAFFVSFWLYKAARRNRTADNRLRRRSPNTTK